MNVDDFELLLWTLWSSSLKTCLHVVNHLVQSQMVIPKSGQLRPFHPPTAFFSKCFLRVILWNVCRCMQLWTLNYLNDCVACNPFFLPQGSLWVHRWLHNGHKNPAAYPQHSLYGAAVFWGTGVTQRYSRWMQMGILMAWMEAKDRYDFGDLLGEGAAGSTWEVRCSCSYLSDRWDKMEKGWSIGPF